MDFWTFFCILWKFSFYLCQYVTTSLMLDIIIFNSQYIKKFVATSIPILRKIIQRTSFKLWHLEKFTNLRYSYRCFQTDTHHSINFNTLTTLPWQLLFFVKPHILLQSSYFKRLARLKRTQKSQLLFLWLLFVMQWLSINKKSVKLQIIVAFFSVVNLLFADILKKISLALKICNKIWLNAN